MEGAFIMDGPFRTIGNVLEYKVWNQVASAAQEVAFFAAPFCLAGMTIWILIYGYAIMRGEVHEPVTKFTWEAVKKAFILSIALSSGLYQTEVVETFNLVSNGLMNALTFGFAGGNDSMSCLSDFKPAERLGVYSALDCATKMTVDVSEKIMGIVYTPPFALDRVFSYLMAAIGIFVMWVSSLVVFVFVGIEVIGMRITMMLVLALGPLFIASLAFEPFKKYFDGWASNIAHIIVLQALIMAMLGIMFALISSYVNKFDIVMAEKGNDLDFFVGNLAVLVGGLVVLISIVGFMFTRLPMIAGTLTGHTSNSSLGSIAAISQTTKMIASLFKGGKSPASNKSGGKITPT